MAKEPRYTKHRRSDMALISESEITVGFFMICSVYNIYLTGLHTVGRFTVTDIFVALSLDWSLYY